MCQTILITTLSFALIGIGVILYRWYKAHKPITQTPDWILNDSEYGEDEWYIKLPDSVVQHLQVCFEGDERKIYHMKRAIEHSIEHFAMEMADDAQCARIIEERVFKNPQPTKPFDPQAYTRGDTH